VTEQEQLTAALRKSEVELRQILDLAPQLIAVLGPKRERLYVNRTALTYLGTTLDEWRQRVMGEPGSEAHPDDAERIKAVGERAIITGSPYELEVRLRGADGRDGAHPGRDRDRQGTGGPRRSQAVASRERGIHPGELRGHSAVARRVRAVRAREGRVYGRGAAPPRPLRGRRWRHDLLG